MKRVICCLDGTWNHNRPGAILTNVGKLHQVIAANDGNGVQQVSHYIEGIVSAEAESMPFLTGGIGFGVDDRIRKAYEVLARDYEPGDEIYLFGFSRGAFEARSLSGLMGLVGIAKAGGGFALDKAWSLYQTSEARRDPAVLAELRAAAHYPVRIKCIGVWDTVGNLGNPFVSGSFVNRHYAFHDMRLTENIEVALHALSIDEPRGPFRPTLWTLPKGRHLPAHQQVEQVWFPGTHADVGGGHRETGLSDVALMWMVERVQRTTGLAVDTRALAHLIRPDPLGPQHTVAEGWIFKWSRLFPFIRLVKQAKAGIPLMRRLLIGSWRTGKLRRGEAAINESIHDSVLERFDTRVIELGPGGARMLTYRPRNLAPVVPEQAPAPRPEATKLRRVKIFTVHGTFAHEADWHKWDKDPASKKREDRAFINRLREHLEQRGVVLDELDHTPYVWSGGNSHDERRVAAIGLKKLIQQELDASATEHGKDYYDKIFIIAHSHGGTIARLAMNLWDKDEDYYDPFRSATFDEIKHDDQCSICMRTRNGLVGRNSVRRPDGVITFGSPFVSFEKRWGGLLTARIGVWVFRIMALLPILSVVYYLLKEPAVREAAMSGASEVAESPRLRTLLIVVFPLALYWLLGVHLVSRVRAWTERRYGKGDTFLSVGARLQAFKYFLLALLGVYYIAYTAISWENAVKWLPVLKPASEWFWWLAPLVLLWLLIMTLPGRFLAWMRDKVVALKAKLPKKHDPAEDRPVAYLSYHTPGDEARVHLRLFGALTWLVQTLGLSAACVLAAGIALTVIIVVEVLSSFLLGGSVMSRLGISAWQAEPAELRDRFVALMNWLTYFPSAVWTKLFDLQTALDLSGVENPRDVAWYIPIALLAAVSLLSFGLMPVVLILVSIAYAVSIRLRGSGLVFGSESFAWTMANRIGVRRRANDNTRLRIVFISPEAWRRQELAHCYYYKSDKVIADVASYIADWSRHRPSLSIPVGAWLADVGRWAVVALFVLSIFTISVPIANAFAGLHALLSGKPAPSKEPGSDLEQVEGAKICKANTYAIKVQIHRDDNTPTYRSEGDVEAEAHKKWQQEITAKFPPEWTDWHLAERRGQMCVGRAKVLNCEFWVRPCKPRALECKVTHAVEIGFELSADLDVELRTAMTDSVLVTLKQRWSTEVDSKLGSEWAELSLDEIPDRRQRVAACNEEDLGAGRIRYTCKAATTPCKFADTQPAR